MGQQGNDWNSMLQSRPMRLALNGLCTLFSAYYALDAVLEMLSPERSAALMGTVGETGYYAITIARLVVCLWVAIVFGRMTYQTFTERDEG